MSTLKGQVDDDIARIHRVLDSVCMANTPDPLAHCMSGLDEQGMRLNLSRMPLTKAVWQAHLDSPVIVWCEKEKLFLTILQAGAFRIRLIKQGDSEDQITIMSRAALARRLLSSQPPSRKRSGRDVHPPRNG
jgi:hypothetical protein